MVQILISIVLGVFRKMNIFWGKGVGDGGGGMMKLWIFGGGGGSNRKTGLFLGVISKHSRAFFKVKVQNLNILGKMLLLNYF